MSLWISKMISLTVIIFILLELFSWTTIKLIPTIDGILNNRSLKNIELDARVNSPQYIDKDYARTIFADSRKYRELYHPYTVWISGKLHSKTTNIDQHGIRKTYNPPVVQSKIKTSKRIFVFGASTVYGLGADDNNTIPSFLSKIINKRSHYPYQVFNFGTPSYTSSQELSRLIVELRNNNIPDYVIFYDGIADTFIGVYNPGIPDSHLHYFETALSYNNHGFANLLYSSYSLRLIGHIKSRLFLRFDTSKTENMENRISRTLNNYKRNIEIVHALSKQFKFKYYVFFQPVLSSTIKPKTEYEKMIYDNNGIINIIFKKTYDKIKDMNFNGYNFFNISDVFDKTDREVYIDWAHVGTYGNELLAKIMYKYVKKDIR